MSIVRPVVFGPTGNVTFDVTGAPGYDGGDAGLPFSTIWHLDAATLSDLYSDAANPPTTPISGSDGDLVGSAWQGSGSKNWNSSNDAQRTVYRTNRQNGLSVLEYGGTDERMAIGSAQGVDFSTAQYTIFIVVKVRSTGTSQGIFSVAINGGNDFSTSDAFFLTQNADGTLNFFQGLSGTGIDTTTVVTGSYHLITVAVGGGARKIRVDGTQEDSHSTPDVEISNASLFMISGARMIGGPANFGLVDIGQIAVYDSLLPDSSIDTTETHLLNRWGL